MFELQPPTVATDIVPVLATSDVVRTLHQYRDAGFTARVSAGGDYGYLRLGDARLHVTARGSRGAPAQPATALLFVEGPDALADAFRAAGHGSVDGPEDKD